MHDPKTGKPALDASIVSAWSVAQQACSLVAQMIAPFPTDWFGRRASLAGFIVLGALACIIEIVARDWRAWLAAKAVMGIAMGMIASCPLTLMAEIT